MTTVTRTNNRAIPYPAPTPSLELDLDIVSEPEAPAGPTAPEVSRLVRTLRGLGVGAVALSAVLFMLQGFEHAEAELRNWAWLGLVVLLGGAGLLSHFALKEPKGARLLFALCIAVVPAQFSQLGAIAHELSGPGPAIPPWLFSGATTPTILLAGMGATYLLTAPLVFVGFSVLARPDARRLSAAFLALSTAMLVPARDSALGFIVIAVMLLAGLALERGVFRPNLRYHAWEGLVVRALFALPVAVVLARALFHIDSTDGYCAMAAVAGAVLLALAPNLARVPGTIAHLSGVVLASGAWVVFSAGVVDSGSSGYDLAMVFAPVSAFAFVLGALRPRGIGHRAAGSVLASVVFLATMALEPSIAAKLIGVAIGVGLLTWGVHRRERASAIAGTVLILCGTVATVVSTLTGLELNAWVGLAIAGVLAVLGASAYERYAAQAAARLRLGYTAFVSWE